MTRLEYRILNVTAGLLVALLLAHFFVSRATNRLGAQLVQQRNAIANARQVESILQQLTQRVAKGGEVDPRLKALLPRSATPPPAAAAPAPVTPPAPAAQPSPAKTPRK